MIVKIIISEINLYLLCPFLAFFCAAIPTYISMKAVFTKYSLLENICVSLGEMLSIIPYIISNTIMKNLELSKKKKKAQQKRKTFDKKRIKSISSQKSQLERMNTVPIRLEYTNIEKKISTLSFKNIIFLGTIDFLQSLFFFYATNLFYLNYQLYLFSIDIFFLILFSKFLLLYRIYKHQLLSLFIFFFGDIIFSLIIILDPKISFNNYQIIFIIFSNICFSLEIVYEKKIMEKKFISPYKLCFILGITSFVLNLISLIITTLLTKDEEKGSLKRNFLTNFFDFWDELKKKDTKKGSTGEVIALEIMLMILFIIVYGFYNVFQFLTIKNLTPNHVLITKLMLAIFYYIVHLMEDDIENVVSRVLTICLYVIALFTLFIFLEIIELNIFELNRDTKRNIRIRAAMKDEELLKVDSQSDNSNSSDSDDENNKNNVINEEELNNQKNDLPVEKEIK